MLIVRYQLSTGERGEDVVVSGDKWVFGRPGGDETPDVAIDDRRISRTSLVIRDSGPGPVVFRGQRGSATVRLISTDGTAVELAEGTAGHFTAAARRVELALEGERVVAIEVDFAERGSVVERQSQGEVNPLVDVPSDVPTDA